jgi:hypothetical protein
MLQRLFSLHWCLLCSKPNVTRVGLFQDSLLYSVSCLSSTWPIYSLCCSFIVTVESQYSKSSHPSLHRYIGHSCPLYFHRNFRIELVKTNQKIVGEVLRLHWISRLIFLERTGICSTLNLSIIEHIYIYIYIYICMYV